ncbi:MAG TPA: lysophospholipid acyltransferase family protein, partial [Longimicrobiales bacterium]|nr:lysophospholipid acyltransferase family protein [Longimicrobiales bacterium]
TGLGKVPPDDTPLVVVANHESWWDGFLIRGLQRRVRPRGRFHAVMLQTELTRYSFLRFLGGLGIAPGSAASVRRMLRLVASLGAERPAGVLAYFPQGRIRPGSLSPLEFHGGVVPVIEAMAPAGVLPVGIRILPGKDHRMDAYLSVGEPIAVPCADVLRVPLLEAAVCEELHAIGAFVREHGEDAFRRYPHPLGRLPRSTDLHAHLHEAGNWISRN